jgi:hypothetical protein
MFYLLSEKQKKKITIEYWTKMLNLTSVSLFVVLLIAVCLSLPTGVKMYSEYSSLNESIVPLENELSSMKVEVAKGGVVKILNDVEILNQPGKPDISKAYSRFIDVVESVSGAKIQGIRIDTSIKTIDATLSVRDKEVAQALVKKLTDEHYSNAELPYTVLSQRASFIFPQRLTYEE